MERKEEIIRICCLCNRIKNSDGWVEQERAQSAVLSHGYCPQCYVKVIRGIEKRLLLQH